MSVFRQRAALLAAFLLGAATTVLVGGFAARIPNAHSHEQQGPTPWAESRLRVLMPFLREGQQQGATRWAENRLRVLKPFLREGAVAAELGVLKGELSRQFVNQLRPTRLHLVDPWYLQGAEWAWEKGDRSTVHALEGILQSFQVELARAQVVLNIDFDQDFLATLPDGYLDWAYIDTTHEYAQTQLELRLLQQKVKASGVIAGDDWQPDPAHPHHGVYKAVHEVIAQGRYRILYADAHDLQWVIAQTAAVP
jgi:hypothetical protein